MTRRRLAALILLSAAGALLIVWKMAGHPAAPAAGSAPHASSPAPAGSAPPAPPPAPRSTAFSPATPRPAPAPAAIPAAAPGPGPAPDTAAAPVVRRRFAPAPAAARLPLVFAMPPEEMTGLNERQTAAAIAIADQFYETTGGETADPSTADYKDRWKREQPLADYQLRAAIGAPAYARYQEAAYLRAKAAAAP